MIPTNLWTVREDLQRTILAINPVHPYLQEKRFTPVDSEEKVAGGKVRNFCLKIVNVKPAPALIYGGGLAMTAELQVWVCYSGVPEDVLDSMVGTDSRQIALAVEARTSPALEGFLAPDIENVEYTEQNDQEGAQYGVHSMQIAWLDSDHLD